MDTFIHWVGNDWLAERVDGSVGLCSVGEGGSRGGGSLVHRKVDEIAAYTNNLMLKFEFFCSDRDGSQSVSDFTCGLFSEKKASRQATDYDLDAPLSSATRPRIPWRCSQSLFTQGSTYYVFFFLLLLLLLFFFPLHQLQNVR